MDVLVERVAGLDVGKEIVVVCVRTPGQGGRRVSETGTHGTMSRSLEAMADWLVESPCGHLTARARGRPPGPSPAQAGRPVSPAENERLVTRASGHQTCLRTRQPSVANRGCRRVRRRRHPTGEGQRRQP
jgi:hypothetical protein